MDRPHTFAQRHSAPAEGPEGQVQGISVFSERHHEGQEGHETLHRQSHENCPEEVNALTTWWSTCSFDRECLDS